MKRKEICEKTGLTPKALRLYEEKELIQPKVDSAGHNHIRDYSPEDLQRLTTISMLRRALFTLAEIKEMLDSPKSIQVIYPEYLQWLRQQKTQLDQLLEVSASIDIAAVRTADELTEKIKAAAERMPLPVTDVHFNFRKLDELEDKRVLPTAEQLFNARLPDKTYRQSYVAMTQNRQDNFLVTNDLINDTRRVFQPEEAPVGEREDKTLTLRQRRFRLALTIAAVLLGLLLCCAWNYFLPLWIRLLLLTAFLTAAGARIFLAVRDHRNRQKQWLSSIGWGQASFAVNKKKVAGIITGSILLLGLLVGGAMALAEYKRPVETMEGPSTAEVDLKEFWAGVNPKLIGPGVMELGEAEGIAAAPNKIYFIYWGTLYSINADYTEPLVIDTNVLGLHDGSFEETAREGLSSLIYQDGCIYYLTWQRQGRHLMRHQCGTKIKPERLVSGDYSAIGFSPAGEIVCYVKRGEDWEEAERVPIS